MNFVGWNGSVQRAEETVISVYDHGFLYGMGLFETFRTYGGKPYLLEHHLRRMEAGCSELGIACPSGEEYAASIREWLSALMKANGLEDAYVRLTITAGEAGLGLPAEDYSTPNTVLLVKPLPPMDSKLYQAGKQLAKLKTSRNTPEGGVRLKSLHYMNNLIAKRELRAVGAAPNAEGLMLTQEGWLAEGIVSNLFIVRDRQIYTPAIETGILPGITRQRVIELAKASSLFVHEGLYTWEDLLQADEVWITNSIQELVPITALRDEEGKVWPISEGAIGTITEQLLQDYRKDTMSHLL